MYRIKDRKFIGIRIKDRRKELGLSQEKLAEAIGITYQQLQRYEGGKGHLNTDRLQSLSDVLNVPIAYLFEDKDPKKATIGEADAMYITQEEREFVEILRKITDEESKKSLKVFMKLAEEKKKRS
ncbi:MAG: hypothetical protein A2Z47_04720 [Thermodesulfovibrio sp. RBG_19FT_COMBO_42_12]|nr:MAG: hypothetical protein A2Z47_04720 [Thermodesulfovibrio sp. RBG_19FT_COMBO_42_12]